jgi:flagellar hook assembly protein FlgD
LARPVLDQNRPNPFNPLTRIAFAVPGDCSGGTVPVSLTIYSVDGRTVRRLIDARLPAGRHSAVWDGRDDKGKAVAAGVYFYRLTAGSEAVSKRMVLLK